MDNSAAIAAALATGDISGLNAEQRGQYYKQVCESLQLNYLTSPLYFQAGEDGRETLAVNKVGAAQLRKIHGISIIRTERQITNEFAIFTVYGKDKDNREDSATGVSTLDDMGGQRAADAIMGAETKAKNRLTVSLAGVGFLDSSEVSGRKAMPGALAETSLKVPESAIALVTAVNQAPATETADTRPQELPGTPVSAVQAQGILKAAEAAVDAPKPALTAPEQPVLAPEAIPAAPKPQPQPETPAVAPAAPIATESVEDATNPVADPKVVQAIEAPAQDIPATPAEYAVFVTNRASKLLRDVLQKSNAAKNPNQLLQDWFIKESGKASLKKISAATWERMLSMIENKPAEEVVSILKGGKK